MLFKALFCSQDIKGEKTGAQITRNQVCELCFGNKLLCTFNSHLGHGATDRMRQIFSILLDDEHYHSGYETGEHIAFSRSSFRIERLTTPMDAAG